jgi:molybdopterin synthase sulfur carrier subunit
MPKKNWKGWDFSKMMLIKVKAIMEFAKLLGGNENKFSLPEGSSIGNLLKYLEEIYGQLFADLLYKDENREMPFKVLLLVNGRNMIFHDGLNTILKEGDELFIYPPICGG